MKNITIFPAEAPLKRNTSATREQPPEGYACANCGNGKFCLISNGDCVCSVCGEISDVARCYASEKPFGDDVA